MEMNTFQGLLNELQTTEKKLDGCSYVRAAVGLSPNHIVAAMKQPILSVTRTTLGLDDNAIYLALLRTGRDVLNFDDRRYAWHEAPNWIHKVARRLNRSALGRAFNAELIMYIRACRPALFVVFKHAMLSKEVVLAAKSVGAKSVCIYPDLDPFVHGKRYVEAVREFDEFFHTKPNLVQYFRSEVNCRAKLVGPFYDPACIGDLQEIDPAVGVSFVGHHSPGKQRMLSAFARCYRGTLTIVGERWASAMFDTCSARVRILPAVYGPAVYEIYRRSVCSLGLLQESFSSRTPGDEVTARTILVPAYGGLLLHARTPAAERLFGARSGVVFDCVEQAVSLTKAIESDPGLRRRLAVEQQSQALAFGTNVDHFVAELLCD
jgi:hypothetical protein